MEFKAITGAREMTQEVKSAYFQGTSVQFPAFTLGMNSNSKLLLLPAPGDLMPLASKNTFTHVTTHIETHGQAYH